MVVHLNNNKAELVYKKKRDAHRKKGSFEFGPNAKINILEGDFEGRKFCLSLSAPSQRRMFYICAKYVNSIGSLVPGRGIRLLLKSISALILAFDTHADSETRIRRTRGSSRSGPFWPSSRPTPRSSTQGPSQ